jgi:hypothetical protein
MIRIGRDVSKKAGKDGMSPDRMKTKRFVRIEPRFFACFLRKSGTTCRFGLFALIEISEAFPYEPQQKFVTVHTGVND